MATIIARYSLRIQIVVSSLSNLSAVPIRHLKHNLDVNDCQRRGVLGRVVSFVGGDGTGRIQCLSLPAFVVRPL